MNHYHFLIKPTSSLCNLECSYCFYKDISNNRLIKSYGIMSNDTSEKIIGNIYNAVDDGDSIIFAFQGGEPTLAGISYFQHFVNTVKNQSKKIHVQYSFQTNGILLDEAWCGFLSYNNFLVGLSIDGCEKEHDRYRVFVSGEGSFEQVIKAKNLLDLYKIEYNVLCTLTEKIAENPEGIWSFLLKEKIKYVQFTPCIGEIEKNLSEWVLTPKSFAAFYITLFELWHLSIEATPISIKFFDDIINFFLFNKITSCGFSGDCQMQNIIEADGSIFPCDFYVLDKYCCGNLEKYSYNVLMKSPNLTKFLAKDKLAKACSGCIYKRVCQGGCKRMTNNIYLDDNGYCGYKNILDEIGSKIIMIGKNRSYHNNLL